MNPRAQSIAVDPQTPSTLYSGLSGPGVQRSVDGGASWTSAGSGVTSIVYTLAVDPRVPARVYGGTEVGVIATTNGGASWATSNAGLANTKVQALAADPSNSLVAYAGTSALGIFKTVDGAATWAASNGGLTSSGGGFDVRAIAIDPVSPQTVYLGNGTGMWKTVNGGFSWTAINHGTLIRNISSIVIDPATPATIRVGTFFTGVFVSTNGGETWASENAGLPPPQSVNALASGSGAVLASTPNTGTFAHALAASTWQAMPGLLPFQQLSAVGYVSGNAAATGLAPRDAPAGGLFVGGIASYDSSIIGLILVIIVILLTTGVTAAADNVWGYLPAPVGVVAATCPPIRAIIGAPTPGSFYAGGACGVLAGTNYGQQVTALNNGLPSLQVTSLAVTPSGADLYAGTEGGGVFRYTKSGSVSTVDVVEYYNAALDHYFITWVPAEQANLDAGNTPTLWTRTGVAFRAYTTPPAGASPVCRYYIPPAKGDSHFFGRGTQECTSTGQNNPTFVLESPDFMQLFLPVAGTCAAGTVPIYRVFSNRPDANHRYMTDKAIRAEMVARGWLVEGDGPDAVVMCGPA